MGAIRSFIRTACAVAGIVFVALAQAQQAAPTPNELEAANQAAAAAVKTGPTSITLGEQAILNLPAAYGFIPRAEAARLMTALGNYTDEGFMGLIVGEKMKGFVSVRYDKAGYIKDEDAKDWNADDMLQNLKDGTEEGNKERLAHHITPMEVVGWIEKPTYEAKNHRLVWSVSTRDKDAPPQAAQGINYNTYVLGREGYLSLNLVTDLASVESEKPSAHELLKAVAFNQGKRYEDFNASTDHVAEYGLAALVGGIAAKKLGLLALAGAFFLKTWKVVLLAIVGIGAGVRKFFGNKKPDAT